MKESTKSTAFKTFGWIFVISAIVLGILGAGMYISPTDSTDPSDGILIGSICTPIFLIPGAVLLYFATKAGKKDKNLSEVAGYLRTYRRIKVSEVARKIGKSQDETMSLINECVEKDMVDGHIDRETNEFFTDSSLKQERRAAGIDECPNCGASVDKRVLKGETVKCDYCGGVINEPPKSGDNRDKTNNNPAPPPPP